MKALPIVERELRTAARGKAFYRWRTLIVALGLALMTLLTLFMTSDGTPAEIQGRRLFNALVLVSWFYVALAAVAATSDSISREKREGTLGLLFLTDLRGTDIILGKLAASSLNLIYGLFGLLPLLAIPVMLGGISIETGLLATLSVVNLLFVSLSIGMLVSSLSWDERRATFGAIITLLALLFGPMLLGGIWLWMSGRGPLVIYLISSLSPLFPLISSLGSPSGPAEISPFYSLIPAHLLAWIFLFASGFIVERSWHSKSGAPVRRTIDERVFTAGNPQSRARHRRSMLDAHPLVWLLERHPGKRFYADILVFAIMAIWVWGYRTYGTGMFGGPTWFLIVPLAFVVHLILASWVVAESSMRLIEDRRTGALELLLCTSLSDRDIIQGHRLALRRLFLRPVLLLVAAEVFVAFNGFGVEGDEASRNGRWMMLALASAVALDTHGLSWIALRLAISLPTVNRVGVLALAITPLGPLVLTACAGVLGAMLPQKFGTSFSALLALWFTSVVLVNLVVGQWLCRSAVLREFRDAVARLQPKAAVAG
ncbi:MAG: ABC transporter permease subunit [Verrucomicrobiales bacterium]|nr:ABC transporter permease subunit [Verrucomicrobiales bacterium]